MLIIRIKDRWNPSGTRRVLVGTKWMHRDRKFISMTQGMCDTYGVQHAFHEGRSQVTNAMAHIGWAYTMTMRLVGLFSSLERATILERVDRLGLWAIINGLLHENHAHTGLTTTPAISNIMASDMDRQICKMNRTSRFGRLFAYTRYAEALYFSYNGPDTGTELRKLVPMAARLHGYDINEKHTTVQAAAAGRRIISGIAVDDKLHPSRRHRRKERAILSQAIHHESQPQRVALSTKWAGLKETMLLKPPKGYVAKVVPLNKPRRRPDPAPASTAPVGIAPPPNRPMRKFDL